MTKDQMEKKMKQLEKKMQKLGVEAQEAAKIGNKGTKWLVVSIVGYIGCLLVLDYNPLMSIFILAAAVTAFSIYRSYEKEATEQFKEYAEKNSELAKQHLHLRIRSDPDGFIKSILEGTLND